MKELRILIDTREQRPWCFPDEYRNHTVTTQRATLKTGDYSIEGHGERGICIERKESWDEIAGNVTKGRDRFRREFERMTEFDTRLLIVCEPLEVVTMGQLRSRIHPRSLIGSVCGLCEEFKVPFLFVRDRHAGMRYAMSAMLRYLNRQNRK